jgi:hypothetical protein
VKLDEHRRITEKKFALMDKQVKGLLEANVELQVQISLQSDILEMLINKGVKRG